MNYAVIERKEKENCQKCPHGHGQGGPPVTSIIMMWGANNKVERERERTEPSVALLLSWPR